MDLGSSHHANKRWQDPSSKLSHISWKQVREWGEKPQLRTTRSYAVLGAGPDLVCGFLESS